MLPANEPIYMQIIVNVIGGKTTTLNVESYYTINNVKAIIRYKLGIPINVQRFSFVCTELEYDDATLKSYNVVEGVKL